MTGDSPLRTLLVDNYDSFTFNLFHYLAEVNGSEPVVVPNDWAGWDESVLESFDNVVISPGPGAPEKCEDFGICAEVLARTQIPVLGICLGHQGMAAGGGGTVDHAPTPMHGRVSAIEHTGEDLFAGLPSPLNVVRYHSLTVTEVPAELEVTAETRDGIVMGLRHRTRPQWGVQFHPESISTEHGMDVVRNFADLTRRWQAEHGMVPSVCRAGVSATAGVEGRAGVGVDGTTTVERSGLSGTESDGETTDEDPSTRVRRPVLHVRRLPLLTTSEALFGALFADEATAVWLDGNLPGHASSRFSVMGAPNVPLSRVVRADVATLRVRVS